MGKHTDVNQSIDGDPDRLIIGEGYISGYLSIFFGALSLGGVLCFLFPEFLTTPDFRNQYPLDALRYVLQGCLLLSFLFALASLILCKTKTPSLIGAVISTLAILVAGAGIEIGRFNDPGFHISLDWLLLDLLALAAIFIPLELFLPKHQTQSKFHAEWRTDLLYFAIGHLFVQLMAVTVQAPAKLFFGSGQLAIVHGFIQGLPFLFELFLAVLIADVFQYAAHRAFHQVPFLWRFHSVHHSIRNVDWLAGSRLHLVDIIVTRAFSYLPIYALGFSVEVFYVYVVIVSLQAVMAHANTRLPFGVLRHLVVTPQYHFWHHSNDPTLYDKNFAIHFPWLDRIFRTHHLPGDEWPSATGLDNTAFPKGYLRQLVFPLRNDPTAHIEMVDASER